MGAGRIFGLDQFPVSYPLSFSFTDSLGYVSGLRGDAEGCCIP